MMRPGAAPSAAAAGLTCAAFLGVAASAYAQPAGLRRQVEAYVETHQRAIVHELVELLKLPNVAADRANIRRNADALRAMLAARGFAAEILETAGNPLVYGELRTPGAARTLLLYCHYDGQPVDPKGWKQASPFTPVFRTGRLDEGGREIPNGESLETFFPETRIYARSASDDKAPIVAILAAVDALKAQGAALTSNVRLILDGEEEASSPSLVPAIARYRDKFTADMMLVLDGPIHFSGRPTIAFGARGIMTTDLTVYGPKVGVHSGNYGNWVPNPAQRLVRLLSTMKDDEGRVLVKGFYDGIAPLTPDEQAMVDAVPDESARLLWTFGIAGPELASRSLQQGLQAPTLNIRGLASSFVGANARTIIPDKATAALDVRLVKETTAESMRAKLEDHIRAQGYHLVSKEPDDDARAKYSKIAQLTNEESMAAFRTSPLLPASKQLVATLTRVWGAPPISARTLGGSVPIAPFINALGFPAMLLPVVNFDNNQHEENENLRVDHLFRAVVSVAGILTME